MYIGLFGAPFCVCDWGEGGHEGRVRGEEMGGYMRERWGRDLKGWGRQSGECTGAAV